MPLAEPLGARAVLAVIDMQVLFSAGEWATPDMAEILPNVLRLAGRAPARALYSRFIPAETPAAARGRWRTYFRRWEGLTGARLAAGAVGLVDGLTALAEQGSVIDKTTYSAFEAPAWEARIAALGADTLVFCGVETDACVLATLLTAVDRGYRVILASDATASASRAAHRAVVETLLPRQPEQVEIAGTDEILRAWTA